MIKLGKVNYKKGVLPLGKNKYGDAISLDSSQIHQLNRLEISVKEIHFTVIAVLQKGWIFLCNNPNAYEQLLDLTAEGKICQVYQKAAKNYNVERIWWMLLYTFSIEKYHLDSYKLYREWNLSDNLYNIDILHPDLDSDTHRILFITGTDWNQLYQDIKMLLPENLEAARLQERKNAVLSRQNKLIEKYGLHWERAEHFLNRAQGSSEEELEEAGDSLKKEICFWQEALDGGLAEKEWTEAYLIVLSRKETLLKQQYLRLTNRRLENDYGQIPDQKIALLSRLRKITFQDALFLYRSYMDNQRELEEEYESYPCAGDEPLYPQYIEFFRLGSVLVSQKLNQLNINKSKQKYIAPDILDQALMYFYETKTPEEARQLQQKEDYLENRKNGLAGENEVAYALKWLDSKYQKISKQPTGRYGEKSILLCNPALIDEPQEFDHIVIGPQGVFQIETKNYVGKLIVDKNGNWIRIKRDGVEEGERNPLSQLRRHEKVLRSILGEEIPIISILCMAHPKMIIEGVEYCPVPLIKSDLLVEYIEQYPAILPLTEAQIQKCLDQIESYRVVTRRTTGSV